MLVFSENELKKIYLSCIKKELCYEELDPIKRELYLIINNIKFKKIMSIDYLINFLWKLSKQGKLEIINDDFINFALTINYPDRDFFNIFEGLIYSNESLNNNLFNNAINIKILTNSFYFVSNLIINKPESSKYLVKYHPIYFEILKKYMDNKYKVMSLTVMYKYMVMSDILELVCSYIYINIESFNYDYDLIDFVMDELLNNTDLLIYYLVKNNLFNYTKNKLDLLYKEFNKQFIVIGTIVKNIINKKIKVLN